MAAVDHNLSAGRCISYTESTNNPRNVRRMVTVKTQYNLKNAKEYFDEHLCVGGYHDEGHRRDPDPAIEYHADWNRGTGSVRIQLRRRWPGCTSSRHQEEIPMPQVTMSFEQRRKVLLNRMTAHAKGQTVKKVIRFQNDDVPQFLRGLERFEKESRRSRLVVK